MAASWLVHRAAYIVSFFIMLAVSSLAAGCADKV
jgi:hypothetical protein